jgi:signal transduction histidine kinase
MANFSENVIYRRLRVFINRQLGPSSLPGEGIQYWRERIFHYFSLAVVFFGVAVYLYYGLVFLLAAQYLFLAFATSVFVSSLLVVSIHRIPLSFRIGWVLFILYLTGSFLLFHGANSTMGLIFLYAATIMGGTLSGAGSGLRYLFLNSLTLTAAGFYWYSGHFTHTDGSDISLQTYINLSVTYLVLNFITLAPLISLLNGMMFTVKKERRYQRILRREQEDLVYARQKAEESDMLKTAFLSNMSHEIRTPMNAILGFSNLLSHPGVTENEKEEFVNLIKLNGKNLMSLVEDIIDISKMESGQFEIHNAPCQLHQVLEDVYNVFTDEMRRRGVSNLKLYLKKGIADERIQILADAARLKKVLNNLVGNAIKFTEKGYVEFGYTLDSDHFIQFYVKDTGIGLPAGKEEEIFNRFSKFSNNEDKLYGGTGIGLTIARHLVKHMGGDIWVEPQPTPGTTFFFTIPFQKIIAPEYPKVQAWT